MKKLLLCSFACMSFFMFANTAPTFGPVTNKDVIQASGRNIILINNVDDGDAGSVQNITFTATSSDVTKVVIDSITFNKNNKFAVLYIHELGVLGNSTISVTAKDDGGAPDTYSSTFVINVIKSPVTGATVDLFDNPTNNRDFPDPGEIPTLSNIVQTWDPVEVQTSSTTTGLSQEYGYFIPPNTNDYGFKITAASTGWLYLSTDDDPKNAKQIAKTADGGYSLTAVTLTAGKKYYIRANQRTTFTGAPRLLVQYQYRTGGSSWSTWATITGDQCVPYNDKAVPSTPANFRVVYKGITDVLLSWKSCTDDIRLEGYNVYVDGKLFNVSPVTDTFLLVTGLTMQTSYSVVVRSVDYFKKQSELSSVINITTHATDAIKPNAPTGLKSLNTTGVAVKLAWNKATDAQSEVKGYNVYLNSVKYNASIVFDTFLNITGLTPLTAYKLRVIAIDAGNNESDSSAVFNVSTVAFDPKNNSDGVAKGELTIKLEPVCKQIGLGLQIGIGDVTNSLVKEFNPGAVRKGGIDANWDNFSAYSSGGNTYASFLKGANDLNAFACFVIGIDSLTDYYKNAATVTNLVEYLAGPTSTTWGAKRNSEGYADLMTNCKGIVFEYGNEVWGGTSHKSPFADGYAYSKWARTKSLAMKASPYYNKSKMFTSYSGRNVDSYLYMWNDQILPTDTGQVDWLSVSGYIGGNMNYDPLIETDRSEIQYYRNSNKSTAQRYSGMVELQKYMIKNNKRILPMYMYEGNLTTPSYRGRIGQAIIFADYYLTMNEKRVAVPIVFCFGSNCEWCIMEGAKKLPLFQVGALFNKYCKNTTTIRTEFSTNDLLIDGSNKPIADYAPVGCHAYTDSGHYRVVLFNRDFDKDYIVRINLPDGSAFTNTATIHKIVSATDFSSKDVVYTTQNITNLKDSMLVTIPKYSMMLITFDGPDQKYTNQPVHATNFKKVTKLTIESVSGEYAITTSGGQLEFRAVYEPADAFYKDLTWEVLDNTENAQFNPGTFKLKGSGYGTGNGSVILKATTKDGSNLSDQKTITLSSQDIEDNKDDLGVVIYPNPATDNIIVLTPSEGSTLTIYSAMGSMVLQTNITSDGATIDISKLPSGIYLISVDVNGKRSTKKIYKQ